MKTLALPVVVLLTAASVASAQYRPGFPGGPGGPGGPGYRPTTSPYLNLLGRGNPAINYYGIVRPQQAFANALFGPQGMGGGGIEEQDLTDPELRRGTGSRVMFNNLSHYYNSHPVTGGLQTGGGIGGGYSVGGSGRLGATGGVGTMGGFGGRGSSLGGVGSSIGSFGGYGVPRR